MNTASLTGTEVDLHRLATPLAHTRVQRPQQVRRLMTSIDADGQRVPLAVVAADAGLVLVDGYQRWAALTRLGRDTAQVEVWDGPLSAALVQVLARHQGRAFEPIEQAWMLSAALAEGVSQRALAAALGQDPSWVSRRLALLTELSEPLQEAVREGVLSSWAASRVFVPRAARQHRRCRGVIGGPAPGAVIDPGVGDLVPPLRASQSHHPHPDAGPSAAVHPGPTDPADADH